MKRIVTCMLLLWVLLSFGGYLPQSAYAQEGQVLPQVLCMPGVYLQQATDCTPSGPSEYLTRMAELGVTFPLRPVEGKRLDPALGYISYQYAEMKEGSASLYASLEDAVAGQNAVGEIGPGKLKYVSYIDVQNVNGDLYFQLRSGEWIAARDGIAQRVSLPSSFRGGLEFKQTPLAPFGWVIPLQAEIESKRTPGIKKQDYTGRRYSQYDVVQVFSAQKIADTEWYMVGPDEWIEGSRIGRVLPNAIPPEGVINGRWIEINLFEQTLAVYDQGHMVFATLIASGLEPFWTRPGLFQIYKKLEATPMSGTFELDRSDFYYLQDVPFTLYYDDARALHGAYWRHRLGFPQSHGCVNLSVADAHWLYNWAEVGEWVYVWDPSGKTPTNPEAYSAGGAP